MEAAKTILAMVTNPMYLVKIREAASPLGAVVAEVLSEADSVEKMESIHPSLLILDLSHRPPGWERSVEKARSLQIPVIAYGPHTDTASRDAAVAAGCSQVLANSKFTMELPALIAKYI